MDYLELDGPRVGDPNDLIIVEPPSQLFAHSRRRRPEPPPLEDTAVDVTPDEPDEGPPPVPAADDGTPATVGAADPPSRMGRRLLVLAFLLAILAVLVWYFLLRDGDPGSAAFAQSVPAAPGVGRFVVDRG